MNGIKKLCQRKYIHEHFFDSKSSMGDSGTNLDWPLGHRGQTAGTPISGLHSIKITISS